MTEMLKSEMLRLRNFWEEMVQGEKGRVREEMTAKYTSHLDKVKKHLADRKGEETSP